jgi:hypothetical protein
MAGLGLLALALAYPPVPVAPPQIDPEAISAPAAPPAPNVVEAPLPTVSPLGPVAPGPILSDAPAISAPPSLVPVAPRDAPRGALGSLVPNQAP